MEWVRTFKLWKSLNHRARLYSDPLAPALRGEGWGEGIPVWYSSTIAHVDLVGKSLLLVLVWCVCGIANSADDDIAADTPLKRAANFQPRVFVANNFGQPDEQFDLWVYGSRGDIAQQKLEKTIERKVEEVCRGYEVSERTRQRIELAATADKQRFYRDVDKLRQRYHDQAAEGKANPQKEVTFEATQLRNRLRDLLGTQSFFAKAAKRILIEEFAANGNVTAEDLLNRRHRSNVELAIQHLESRTNLQFANKAALAELVFRETRPTEAFGDADELVVKYRFSHIPEETLKPLFEGADWPRIRQSLAGFQKYGTSLVNDGILNGESVRTPPASEVARQTNRVNDAGFTRADLEQIRVPIASYVARHRPINGDAKAAEVDRTMLIARHRGHVSDAVRLIEQQVPLLPEQREALTQLVLSTISPPRTLHKFDHLAVRYAIAQFADSELKPLFDKDQWPKISQLLVQFQESKELLRFYGLIEIPTSDQNLAGSLSNGRLAADASTPSNRRED